jgi:hypothetical protein
MTPELSTSDTHPLSSGKYRGNPSCNPASGGAQTPSQELLTLAQLIVFSIEKTISWAQC